MNYKGIELEPCQAILQIKEGDNWTDFGSLKDGSDCTYAELMVAGKHPEFKGQFRVIARIDGKLQDISGESPQNDEPPFCEFKDEYYARKGDLRYIV